MTYNSPVVWTRDCMDLLRPRPSLAHTIGPTHPFAVIVIVCGNDFRREGEESQLRQWSDK